MIFFCVGCLFGISYIAYRFSYFHCFLFLLYLAKPKTLSEVVGTGIELHTPRDITEMSVFSGMPTEQKNRTVVIAPRMNKTLQSGGATNHLWQITWKNQERWSNPLMGWTSTADPMSNVKLTFDTQEEAILFANKNGWKFELRAPVPETTVVPGTSDLIT